MPEKEETMGLTMQDSVELQYDIYNKENSRSIFSLVPPSWVPYLEQAYWKHQDLLSLVDDVDFKRHVREKHKISFNPTENQIRYNLWLDYDHARLEGRKIVAARIFGHIMAETTFERYFLKNEIFCVFMLKRPADYTKMVNETLLYGMEKLRSILDLPEHDKKGNLIPKVLELKIKVISMMDMRVHGAPTQKSVNVSATAKEMKELAGGNNMAAIQQRLAELEMKKREALGIPKQTVEVLPALPKE
jgi:hypothetical protein